METGETGSALETPLAGLHKSAGATMASWFGCSLPDYWTDPRSRGGICAQERCSGRQELSRLSFLHWAGPRAVSERDPDE